MRWGRVRSSVRHHSWCSYLVCTISRDGRRVVRVWLLLCRCDRYILLLVVTEITEHRTLIVSPSSYHIHIIPRVTKPRKIFGSLCGFRKNPDLAPKFKLKVLTFLSIRLCIFCSKNIDYCIKQSIYVYNKSWYWSYCSCYLGLRKTSCLNTGCCRYL
jgi:hypothetical protein